MVQAKIKKELQRNKAVIVVFALSPALGRILLMGECEGNLSLSELHHVAATSRTPWPPSLPSKIHYSPSLRPSGTIFNK